MSAVPLEALVLHEFGVRLEHLNADTMRTRIAAWPHAVRCAWFDGWRLCVSTDVRPTDIIPGWSWLGFTTLTTPTDSQLQSVFRVMPTGVLAVCFLEGAVPAEGGSSDKNRSPRAVYFRVMDS